MTAGITMMKKRVAELSALKKRWIRSSNTTTPVDNWIKTRATTSQDLPLCGKEIQIHFLPAELEKNTLRGACVGLTRHKA